MKYTVIYAHLEKFYVKEGDILKTGARIGRMGNTGQSTAKHLHIGCFFGSNKELFTMKDVENEKPKAALRMLNNFINFNLFKYKPVITTPVAEWEYQRDYGKLHLAYDVVPENRHDKNASLDIYWNIQNNGTVLRADYDEKGYGNYVYVEFEA